MDARTTRTLLWIPVVAATAALSWIVPELPFRHLDDPSHWGILAYLGFVALLFHRTATRGLVLPKRLVALFLFGMPVVYVANWVRHGGSGGWLVVELAGLVVFGLVAWLGVSRGRWWLVLGIAGHAMWDVAHLGGLSFVPDWYAIGCAVVDVGIAGFVGGLAVAAEGHGLR